MYCFTLLLNLFISLTTDFTVTGLGTLILCNVQLTMLEIYDALQHNINWKFFFGKKSIFFQSFWELGWRVLLEN